MVTARISDPDDPTSTLKVVLDYGNVGGYSGRVTMKYDASRGVFTYQLPAIKASNATPDGGDLSATITVMDSTPVTRRPATDHTAIAPVDACLGPIQNN